MRKYTATLVMLLLAFGLSGCPIATITESFEYDVLEEKNEGNPFDLTGEGGWSDVIDLTTDDTFNDNKDKIENIDRVTFQASMYTLNDEDAVVDIFFREVVEAGETPATWLPILEGFLVEGTKDATAPLEISYEDSEPLIQNFTQFQNLAEDGIMELALVAREGNDQVLVTELILWIALSGG